MPGTVYVKYRLSDYLLTILLFIDRMHLGSSWNNFRYLLRTKVNTDHRFKLRAGVAVETQNIMINENPASIFLLAQSLNPLSSINHVVNRVPIYADLCGANKEYDEGVCRCGEGFSR